MRKIIVSLILGFSSLFAVSACGVVDLSPDTASSGNDAPAEAPPPAAAPTSEAPPGPGLLAVETALGKIVTNSAGYTLYRWDSDKPGKPTCYGDCAKKWPAYAWSENLRIEGVDEKLVGKVERTDGVTQLTIGNWPVYTFARDKAGEWKGHGVGGTWWAITPEGKKAKAAKPAASSSGYGY